MSRRKRSRLLTSPCLGGMTAAQGAAGPGGARTCRPALVVMHFVASGSCRGGGIGGGGTPVLVAQ